MVESGKKYATIRSTKRAKPGDTLQLYTGLRTRKTRLLKIARCSDVQKITIYKDHIEGIEDFKHYSLPYSCYLYIWTEMRDHKLKSPN